MKQFTYEINGTTYERLNDELRKEREGWIALKKTLLQFPPIGQVADQLKWANANIRTINKIFCAYAGMMYQDGKSFKL